MIKHVLTRLLLAFVVALVVGGALGSIVQSQVNLLALHGLGADIGAGVWLLTTVKDLVRFGPVYLVLFGAGFLLSQIVALIVARRLLPSRRRLVHTAAAAVGLWVTFTLVDSQAPMPTLVAATRDLPGLIAMLVTAAIAGWLFSAIHEPSHRRHRDRGGSAEVVVILLAFSAAGAFDTAQAQPARYQLETVTSGLEHPWSVAFLPDGRMLVTERPGRLRVISREGDLLPEPVGGLPELLHQGQAGLFDVLPAPDSDQHPYVFLSYACGTPDGNNTCLARGRLQELQLVDVEEIFRAQPARKGVAHFGGRLAWLGDRTLLLTLGDGFDYREDAQRLDSHTGKIVRLNQDGSIPTDNPFVDTPGALPEIFSYGHRNVQGLVVDPDSGTILIHEHGARGGDEINRIVPGANYGWPLATHGLDYTWARVTPFTRYPGIEQPLLHWTPSIAPSGMALYTGELFPSWQGTLLVGGLVTRAVHRVVWTGDTATEVEKLFTELNERIRDVRTGPDGALYLLTDSPDGRLIRVVPD